MKNIALIIALALLPYISEAQIKSGTLQASGLTCSMCNLSVLKSLQTLSFIDSIVPNIETASYELTFGKNASINFEEIKKAVEKAGFSVAKLSFVVDLSVIEAVDENMFSIDGINYHIIDKTGLNNAQAAANFFITNKGYLSEKEFKRNKKNNLDDTSRLVINISQY
jgi:copper chaperone CopZ